MNVEELLQKLKQQQEELDELKKENKKLKKELEEELDYSDWCSIDMGSFTTNLAYTAPMFTKEGSHLVRDFNNLSDELQGELCNIVLEEGEINDRVLDFIDDNTRKICDGTKEMFNIVKYRGEERQLLVKSDKFNQWLDSIDKRYGAYIFYHGYSYWLEQGVDLTKPIKMSIRYVCQDKFDITNLSKHFIDYLFSNWNSKENKEWFEEDYPVLDDKVVIWLNERKIGSSDDNYYSSQIYWKFENIDDSEMITRTKKDVLAKKIDFRMKK